MIKSRHSAVDVRNGYLKEKVTEQGEFDVVTMLEVVEHLTYTERKDVFGRIHDTLKPGGWLFVSTIDRDLGEIDD